MVAATCFGITLPSAGSVPSAFWEILNRILWMGVLCLMTWCMRINGGTSLEYFGYPSYIHWPLVSFWPVKNLVKVTHEPTVYMRWQGIRFVSSDTSLSPVKASKCHLQLQYFARMADRVSCWLSRGWNLNLVSPRYEVWFATVMPYFKPTQWLQC
jgi:hypothetical protein